MGDLVAYYRVSTPRQGQSGLGLEAQEASVTDYSRRGGHRILASYREVESGKRADRPELIKALAHAKRARAILIIAKLDRLARNVAFLANLLESGAEFLACDNPTANRLTIHILAAVAEDEARRISERTKAALAAYKARGGQLGTPGNLTAAAGLKRAEATKLRSAHNSRNDRPAQHISGASPSWLRLGFNHRVGRQARPVRSGCIKVA
jgi:DNA invertase Pin-like site-specific DNA recombinase